MSNYGMETRLASERTKRKKGKKLDRLTRDAIAAQEAGMSYGQYKALHPHTPDEDEEPTPEEDADEIIKPAPIALRPRPEAGHLRPVWPALCVQRPADEQAVLQHRVPH